ncbi:MAG: hypothetical protein ACRDUV_08455 [Pseudonocardiaceae bacterium]
MEARWVGVAVAVVLVIGMAGVALFVASRRGHVRRESMQLAATISGPVGALLTAVALIFAAAELAKLGEENDECPLLLPGQAEYRRSDDCVSITATSFDIDRNRPDIPKRNDLNFNSNPRSIRAVKSANIVRVDLDTPDRDNCRAALDSRDPKRAKILNAPKVGDKFCVKTRGKGQSPHYAFGRVDKVSPQAYEVRIFGWKNP